MELPLPDIGMLLPEEQDHSLQKLSAFLLEFAASAR